MTIYVYTGVTKYIEGLPATQIDSTTLNAEQTAKLTEGITAGIYEVGATTTTLRPTAIVSNQTS